MSQLQVVEEVLEAHQNWHGSISHMLTIDFMFLNVGQKNEKDKWDFFFSFCGYRIINYQADIFLLHNNVIMSFWTYGVQWAVQISDIYYHQTWEEDALAAASWSPPVSDLLECPAFVSRFLLLMFNTQTSSTLNAFFSTYIHFMLLLAQLSFFFATKRQTDRRHRKAKQ